MVDPWGVATYAHEASTDLEDSHLQNQQLSSILFCIVSNNGRTLFSLISKTHSVIIEELMHFIEVAPHRSWELLYNLSQ
jgi:hypothetical protein